jgi:acyl-CoA hydrolase
VDFKVFIDEVSEFSDKLLGRSSRERVCEMIRVLTSEFHRWLGRHAGRASGITLAPSSNESP